MRVLPVRCASAATSAAVASAGIDTMSRRTVIASAAVRPDSSERPRQQLMILRLDVAVTCRLVEEEDEVRGRVRHRPFVLRFNADQSDDDVRKRVQEPDDRLEDTDESHGRARARSRDERSGSEIAHDFGAISPTTIWRKTTNDRPSVNPITCNAVSDKDDQLTEQLLRRCARWRVRPQHLRPSEAHRDAKLRTGEHQRELADAGQRGHRPPVAVCGELLDA